MKWLILILMLLVLGCNSRETNEAHLRLMYPDKVIYRIKKWRYIVTDTSGKLIHVVKCYVDNVPEICTLTPINKGVSE